MSAINYFVLCFVIVAASIMNVEALSSEDKTKIMEALLPAFSECSPKFAVEKEALKEAKEKGDYSSVDSCFFACMFKNIGFMTEGGVFDKETTLKKSTSYVSSDEDKKFLEKITNICAKVNDEELTGDDKDCQRAKLLFACIRENKGPILTV